MTAEHRKAVLTLFDALNRHDTARLRELVAADFVDHEPNPVSTEPGREGALAWFEALWAAFPDFHMEVLDVLGEDDRMVARTRMTGTHTGELMGMPPTGRQVAVEVIDIMRFRDGHAVEHWGVTDTAALYTQLGLAPAEGVIETVQAIYQAFGRGDIPAILGLVADDVAWEPDAIDHGVPWIRPGTGRDVAARFFEVIGERLDFTRFEVRDLLASGNRVAAVIDIGVVDRESGQDLSDRSEVHLWTVEDGRVTAFRHHVDTYRHVLAAQA